MKRTDAVRNAPDEQGTSNGTGAKTKIYHTKWFWTYRTLTLMAPNPEITFVWSHPTTGGDGTYLEP